MLVCDGAPVRTVLGDGGDLLERGGGGFRANVIASVTGASNTPICWIATISIVSLCMTSYMVSKFHDPGFSMSTY